MSPSGAVLGMLECPPPCLQYTPGVPINMQLQTHLSSASPCLLLLLLLQVYKYKEVHSGGSVKVEVYVSYGGLLMLLAGDPKKLQHLEVDASLYLLLRKV
jgi:hypothetical protein